MSVDYSGVEMAPAISIQDTPFSSGLAALESDLRSGSTRALLAARGLLGSGQPSKYQGYLEKLQSSRNTNSAVNPTPAEIEYLKILKRTIKEDREQADIFAKAALFAITAYAAVSVGMYFANPKAGLALSITLSAALVVMALIAIHRFHSNNKSKDHYHLEHQNLSAPRDATALDYDFRKHNTVTESVSTFSGRFFLHLGGATSKNIDALAWKQGRITNGNDLNGVQLQRLNEIVDAHEENAKVQALFLGLSLVVCGGLAIGASDLTLRMVATCVGVLAMGLSRLLLSGPSEAQKSLDAEHEAALSPSN